MGKSLGSVGVVGWQSGALKLPMWLNFFDAQFGSFRLKNRELGPRSSAFCRGGVLQIPIYVWDAGLGFACSEHSGASTQVNKLEHLEHFEIVAVKEHSGEER